MWEFISLEVSLKASHTTIPQLEGWIEANYFIYIYRNAVHDNMYMLETKWIKIGKNIYK